MCKQYISVKDMVKNMSSEFFYYDYVNRDIHPIARKMQNLVHLKIYQDRRVYLDEYPEQEQLRKNYFETKELGRITNNILEKIILKQYYPFFYNRWLKRN